MKRFETIATATAPGGTPLTLHRRGEDYFIHLDGEELMSSRTHGSETALAGLALGELTPRPFPRVLIGGLGLGFTLRAALAKLPSRAAVVVAEVVPAIVEWNRRFIAETADALEDRRVTLHLADVAAILRETSIPAFDAILLDVDDGPSAVCYPANEALYGREGLELVRRRLTDGGVLAVWSAQSDPAFAKRLRQAGFAVRVAAARSHRSRGARYVVFLGTRQSAPPARAGARRRRE